MKGKVIDFEILRIQSELEVYEQTGTLPHTILDGVYSLEDIFTIYYDRLSSRHQEIAKDLKQNYAVTVENCITSLRITLKKEYTHIMNDLATEHESFRFGRVLSRYRPAMNPVRALYYEVREVKRNFSSENDYHVWLTELITDKAFRNILEDALMKDILRLEKIIARYYIPIMKVSKNLPLELFHAKQTISDFRHYAGVFIEIDGHVFE
jgi:hypothetical protein